jgi:hypothetical protein
MEGWNNFLLNIIVKLFQSSVCYTIVQNISCETRLEFIQSYWTSLERRVFYMENSAKFTILIKKQKFYFTNQNKKKVHSQFNDVHEYNILNILPHLSYIRIYFLVCFLFLKNIYLNFLKEYKCLLQPYTNNEIWISRCKFKNEAFLTSQLILSTRYFQNRILNLTFIITTFTNFQIRTFWVVISYRALGEQ